MDPSLSLRMTVRCLYALLINDYTDAVLTEQFEPRSRLFQGAMALGLSLKATQRAQFGLLARELRAWNVRVNLTAITDAQEIESRHFVDSLVVAPRVQEWLRGEAGSLIDVGAGAGLPGLALAIALPWLQVTLLEA